MSRIDDPGLMIRTHRRRRGRGASRPGRPQLADRLRTRGWLVPAYSLPPSIETVVIQRVLCRHGFSLDMARSMMADFREQLGVLERHGVMEPMTEGESGGFKHS